MAPEIHSIPLSDDDSLRSPSDYSDSDIGEMPSFEPKTPLNKQYAAAAATKAGPQIDWNPSESDYLKRVALREQGGIPVAALPHGFPAYVQGPTCWSGRDTCSKDLITCLTEDQIQEIELALYHFKGLHVPLDNISRSTFPLPKLGPVLDKLIEDIHSGQGLVILRGLQPWKYNLRDNILIYAGIASYVGELRGHQDRFGNILVHIKDVGSGVASDNERQSPYANTAQPFHNDLGDIIGLYCIDKAMVGGVSRVASAAAVYNELARCRPDLIQELAAPNWVLDKHDGTQSYYSRPILFHDQETGKTFFCFSRRQLTGSSVSPRPSYLPPITEAQAEALDAVHFTAEKLALKIQLEKGDMQFSNNLALFHAREAFQDGMDSNKRHLIRMWLRNEEHAWPTPPELRDAWHKIYHSQRRSLWHMLPNHERAHVINRIDSCSHG